MKSPKKSFKFGFYNFLAVIFLIMLFVAYDSSLADFEPGETLDPECVPGASGCVVAISGGSITYPSVGIVVSTGSAWGTSITDNSSNWNTAYGWGDHSIAGYLTSASATSTYVPYTGATSSLNLGANNLIVDANTLFVNASNNRVGIGTTEPAGALDVEGTIIGNYLSAESGILANTSISSDYQNYGNGYQYGFSTNGSGVGYFMGKLAIGSTNPTASLYIKAGTATAGTAPLKFTSGTNLTTPEAGAMEWDGTNLFITQTSGPTRKTIAYTSDIVASPITVVNTSNLFSTGLTGTGSGVTTATNSIFLGTNAGNSATNASSSNFFGIAAGDTATNASNSNFIGGNAGSNAINASFSTFIGSAVGFNATNASNSIFIGANAGLLDSVNNTASPHNWSILLGYNTTTGGFSNSILLGGASSGTPIQNTKANQFMLAPSITELRWRGVDYTLPSAQGGAGTVLTNNGSGVLSWGAVSGGLSSTADFNTLGGTEAGLNLPSGAQNNSFYGYQAGRGGTMTNAADNNTGIGYRSLYSLTSGTSNTAIGSESLYSNTGGNFNTAIGSSSLRSNTTGYQNSALGNASLYNNTTGFSNVGVGRWSLYNNTTGYHNSALGDVSLGQNTTGYQNTSVGSTSMYANSTGRDNSALGFYALYANTVGNYNVSIGKESLYYNVAGSNNTAVGHQSMKNTSNSSTPFNGNNTALGYNSLMGNTPASGNTGVYNVAIGSESLFNNSTGSSNAAVGSGSLYNNTTGEYNTVVGRSALHNNNTGSYNVAIGDSAGSWDNTPAQNQTGNNSIFIGSGTRPLENGQTNQIVIGHNAIGRGSNTAQWGNTNITNHYFSGNVQFSTYGAGTLTTDASGNITASSDERLKIIKGPFDNNEKALEAILSINPILYKWKDESGYDTENTYAGFSAQNIQEFIPEAVGIDPDGYLTLSDRPILATAVNSIKELNLKLENIYSLDVDSSNSLASLIKEFLADASNTISDLYAKVIHSDRIETKTLCVGDTCVTEEQFIEMVKNSSGYLNNNSSGGNSNVEDQEEIIDEVISDSSLENNNESLEVETEEKNNDLEQNQEVGVSESKEDNSTENREVSDSNSLESSI